MAELRAGGLAIIIKSNAAPSDIGKTVTLVKLLRPGDLYESEDNGELYRHSDNINAWLVRGDCTLMCNGEAVKIGFALYAPPALLPIDGDDFQHEGERKKELSI